jgi:hypothetical protein
MTTITVQRPVAVRVPRATAWAADTFARLAGWVERSSKARAERSRAATRATEAAAVRAYAHRYASHDPRFAADLMAAADRHELSK